MSVESRIHYVKQKEWQEYDTSCFFIKEIFEESTPSKVSKRISLTGLLMLRHRPVKPLRTLHRLASLWIVPTMSISSSLRFSNGFFCWFVKHMLHRTWWNHGVYLLEISIQVAALGSSYNLYNYIFWVVCWNLQKRRNNAWHKSVRYPCDDCVLLSHCVLG